MTKPIKTILVDRETIIRSNNFRNATIKITFSFAPTYFFRFINYLYRFPFLLPPYKIEYLYFKTKDKEERIY